MNFIRTSLLIVAVALTSAVGLKGQDSQSPPSRETIAQVEKNFEAANSLMGHKKFSEALVKYKEALALLPDDPSLLFNAGLAAFHSQNYVVAEDLWKRLKKTDPLDWHVRAKLIQAYQALGKFSERDAERSELFQLRSEGKLEELSKQIEYCRDQFSVKGLKVMAFEHFDLKGDRALRYVFSVLNKTEDGEEFRISLGSYNFTNAVWRETAEPKPKEGERLFHLDGYYKWGHATYGMFAPEPSYDAIRSRVVAILEGKAKAPLSSTINPSPEKKPRP